MDTLNQSQMFTVMMLLSNFRQQTIELLKKIEKDHLVEYQKEISAKDGALTIIDQLSSFIHKDKFDDAFDFSENYTRLKEVLFQVRNAELKSIEEEKEKILFMNYTKDCLPKILEDKRKSISEIFDFLQDKLFKKFKEEINQNGR